MDLPAGPGVSRLDRIVAAITRKPHMTELEIAEVVTPSNPYQQRVNSVCRRLLREGRIERHGKGGAFDPYTYTVKSDA
jgi:hypothetical protein